MVEQLWTALRQQVLEGMGAIEAAHGAFGCGHNAGKEQHLRQAL
jgi:hypothetical protein